MVLQRVDTNRQIFLHVIYRDNDRYVDLIERIHIVSGSLIIIYILGIRIYKMRSCFSRILPRNISPNTVCDRSSRVVSLLSGSVIGRRSSALTGRCRSLHYQEILLMVLSIRKIRLRPRSTRMWRLRRWVIHASSFRQVHNQKARIGRYDTDIS